MAAYLRGTTPTSDNLLAVSDPIRDTAGWSNFLLDVQPSSVNLVTGAGSFLTYAPPALESIAVSLPSSASDLAFLAGRGVECNATDCSVTKLQITGASLGPSTTDSTDSVLRQLVFGDLPPASSNPSTFLADPAGTIVLTWSHRSIVAFVRRRAAQVAVQLTSKSWGGIDQVVPSNVLVYRTLSPAIVSLVGRTTGIPTLGTVPGSGSGGGSNSSGSNNGLLQVTMRNMAAGSPLRVLIGGSFATMFASEAAALAGTTLSADAAGALVALDGLITVWVTIPPGEGANAPVLAQRLDGDGQWKTSVAEAEWTISYAPPTVTSAGVQTASSGQLTSDTGLTPSAYVIRPVASGDRLSGPTDGSRFAILQGINFGLCPTVLLGTATVYFCADNSTGRAASPGAARTHAALAFPIPAGEGSSMPLTLIVGGQSATTLLFFDYEPPSINYSVAEGPDGLPTTGSTRIIFVGSNFGAPMPRASSSSSGSSGSATNRYVTSGWIDNLADPLPPRIRIRLFSPSDVPPSYPGAAVAADGTAFTPSADGYIVCPNVRRYNHTHMSCLMPQGDGARLDVEVQRQGDVTGAVVPAAASYDPPLVTSYTCTGCAIAVDPDEGTGMVNGTGSSGSAGQTPGNATDGLTILVNGTHPTVVSAAPAGGGVLRLEGLGFGLNAARVAADGRQRYCVFLAAPSLIASTSSRNLASVLRCNGVLDSGGEGELEAARLLSRTQTSLEIRLPPGIGRRSIIISVNGGASDARMLTLSYTPPLIRSMAPSRVSTDGGDVVTLQGYAFGLLQLDTAANPPDFSRAVPLSLSPLMPNSCLRINVHRSCVTDCKALDGSKPSVVAPCDYGITRHTDREITFASSPGIGVNRNITVTVIDIDAQGNPVQGLSPISSNVLRFDFLPPQVTVVVPSTVLIRAAVDGADASPITIKVSALPLLQENIDEAGV